VRGNDAARISMSRYRAAVAIVLLPVLTACAHVHVDPDGSTRIFGFVNVTIPAAPSSTERPSLNVPTLSATTWGLGWFSSPLGASLSLGYSQESITRIGISDASGTTVLEVPQGRSAAQRATNFVEARVTFAGVPQ
jgi:hypothetical protein